MSELMDDLSVCNEHRPKIYDGLGKMGVCYLCNEENLQSLLTSAREENVQVKSQILSLLEYSKHSPGCNASFDVRYGCKCGYYQLVEKIDKSLSNPGDGKEMKNV